MAYSFGAVDFRGLSGAAYLPVPWMVWDIQCFRFGSFPPHWLEVRTRPQRLRVPLTPLHPSKSLQKHEPRDDKSVSSSKTFFAMSSMMSPPLPLLTRLSHTKKRPKNDQEGQAKPLTTPNIFIHFSNFARVWGTYCPRREGETWCPASNMS